METNAKNVTYYKCRAEDVNDIQNLIIYYKVYEEKLTSNVQILIFYRATDMLSHANDNITIEMLAKCLPNEFSKLAENEDLCRRIKIEALYNFAVGQQQEQVQQIRQDQAMIIPSGIDYSA